MEDSEGEEKKKKKKVVVIGGGVAGSLVAKTLQDHADVTLIDSKEYFELPWVSLRSMVEPSLAEEAVFNHTDYLPNARVVASVAINITENEVLTAQGNHISYDYLVIATGHREAGAKTRNEKLSECQEDHQKIKSANSILIIGGGPSGVELAGEIAVDFPEKTVTLVHGGSRLLEFIGSKAAKKALEWLQSKKVQVILGQSIDLNSVSDGVYKTSGGETVTADCHFDCTGKTMGSSWLKETILKNSLAVNGRLMVEPNLRVRGLKNVFGVGDITDIPEIKQGYLAERHAVVAAKNVKLLIMGGKEGCMAIYKPASPMAIVTLGRRDAVAQILFVTMIGYIPSMIKSWGFFVANSRKQLGL